MSIQRLSIGRLNFIQLATSIGGVIILSIFGFYALKILSSFRKGVLETGWKQVTVGAIFLMLAQFFIIGSGFGSTSMETIFNLSVFAMRFVGVVLLILGFRAHYQVWRLDNKNISAKTESSEPIEWQN